MDRISAIRAQFSSLNSGVAHFDSPGGTQVPDVVGAAVARTLVSSISNRGWVTAAERAADEVVVGARQAMADLLNADPGGIVFGRSMTQLTYDLSRALAKTWCAGDEVVVTRLDHDADIRPWVQAAEAVGAVVRWVDFDPETAELTTDHVAAVLSPRTRLVAVTGASNLLGTRPDITAISQLVHGVGALLFVDGVHLSAHAAVDMVALGADFYACSPYKFHGPHLGVLAAHPDLLADVHADKLRPSTDQVPERFELGTLPYELLAGATSAVDFLASLAPAAAGVGRRERLMTAMTEVEAHEDALRVVLEDGLAAMPGITLHSRAKHRTPTLLATVQNRDAAAAHRFLAGLDVNAPAGSFYAIEASERIGLGAAGGLRMGLACYTDHSDVRRLLDGIARFLGE
jgi:cysteine desulfurase family protein (TIGR01976 family)